MDSDIILAIHNSIPNYNEYLLRTFQEEQIAKAAEFISTVFDESTKLFSGIIKYRGYRIMSPDERVKFELNLHKGASIGVSELILVNYEFEFNGRIFDTPLYLPYIKNDAIVINDTRYIIRRSVTEKIFSRTSTGITMRVIRSPIVFRRSETFRMESLTGPWMKLEVIPTIIIWQGPRNSRNKRIVETIIHYMLCKFGFRGTIARFGLNDDDCSFVSKIRKDTNEYEYFSAKKPPKNKPVEMFMRVKKSLLEDPVHCKLIASLLYTISESQKHTIEDLYEATGTVYRIMLAEIIHGVGNPRNKNQIDAHIASTDLYLDPITRTRLAENEIMVDDVYDLFQYVFTEIDRIHINSSPINMYNTRIDIISEVLVNTLASAIYHRFYDRIKTKRDPKKFDDKNVKSLLKFNTKLIAGLRSSKTIQKNPSAYGDNWLTSHGIQKMRLGCMPQAGHIISSPAHRFHPSVAVVETLVSFSDTHPGAGGSINPFLEITSTGSVIRPDYADEVDKLLPYLPYQ